jgi:hypothetical protein
LGTSSDARHGRVFVPSISPNCPPPASDAGEAGGVTESLQHGITFSLERNAERGSCETRGAHIYSSAKSPGHPGARITAIRLDSADASVSVVAPGGIESQIRLRRVTGAWKIANF